MTTEKYVRYRAAMDAKSATAAWKAYGKAVAAEDETRAAELKAVAAADEARAATRKARAKAFAMDPNMLLLARN